MKKLSFWWLFMALNPNKIVSRFYETPARNAIACEAGGRRCRSKGERFTRLIYGGLTFLFRSKTCRRAPFGLSSGSKTSRVATEFFGMLTTALTDFSNALSLKNIAL